MKRIQVSRIAALSVALLIAFPSLGAQAKVQLVSTPLNQELAKIFPEIGQGYIDLDGNGKMDQRADLNEAIAESRVRDAQLQSQEILDFIVANWRFIPLDKLRSVQAAVKVTPGALGELIAIDFSSSLDDVIKQKEAMGDGLYLSPSAYKEAMARLSGILSSMTAAYKKEGQKGEADFISARDQLFAMVDKGYPIPQDLPEEDRATLSTVMMNSVIKDASAKPVRARLAIRVLGKLRTVEAAPMLMQLASGKDFPAEAMRALGDLGWKPAIPILANQLKSATDLVVRKAALQATGAIGGSEGLDAILDLVKPTGKASLPPDLLEAAATALAGIAQNGQADPRVLAALKELSSSDKVALRKIATVGLGSYTGSQSLDSLLAIAGGEKDSAVRKVAIQALGRQKGDTVVPLLMKVLRERDLDPVLKFSVLDALGENPGASSAISLIVEALADDNAAVRDSAAAALRKLYPANQQLVTGSITRSLGTSQDENLLAEATALLATLADPSSLPTLIALLQKPQSEVKRSAAWALYRIRSTANPKIVDELQKLITNESESVSVRENAVRAAGAIALDSPQQNMWQTLVTAAQMRGEKYAMLRIFAVRSLGQLGAGRPQVLAALGRIVSRDPDLELRREAATALRAMATSSQEAVDALAAAFAGSDDVELKVRVLEALADMGSDKPAALASDLLASTVPIEQRRRVLYALSQDPSEASANAILDGARDEKLQEFAAAVLEGFPPSFMSPLVARRLRTETDKNVLTLLQSLDLKFSQ